MAAIELKMTASTEDEIVVAEKTKSEKAISVSAPLLYEDAVGCFATVNGEYVSLVRGQSVEWAYKYKFGAKMPKHSQTEIYLYRIFNDCGWVGTQVQTDKHTVQSTWKLSFEIIGADKLIPHIHAAENAKLTDMNLSDLIRKSGSGGGNLIEILNVEILKMLKEIPPSDLNLYTLEIGQRVMARFEELGGEMRLGIRILRSVVSA